MKNKKTPRLARGRFLPQRYVKFSPALSTEGLTLSTRSNILFEPVAVLFDVVAFKKALSSRLNRLYEATIEEFRVAALLGLFVTFILTQPLASAYKVSSDYKVVVSKLSEAPVTSSITSSVESLESPEYSWPVVGTVSQKYTYAHKAIDVRAPLNTPIKPLAAGSVESAFTDIYGLGKTVIIRHIDGSKSLYAHLNKILVKQDQKVEANTQIGTIGLSGRTTGPHVHLEVEDKGKKINPAGLLPTP